MPRKQPIKKPLDVKNLSDEELAEVQAQIKAEAEERAKIAERAAKKAHIAKLTVLFNLIRNHPAHLAALFGDHAHGRYGDECSDDKLSEPREAKDWRCRRCEYLKAYAEFVNNYGDWEDFNLIVETARYF